MLLRNDGRRGEEDGPMGGRDEKALCQTRLTQLLPTLTSSQTVQTTDCRTKAETAAAVTHRYLSLHPWIVGSSMDASWFWSLSSQSTLRRQHAAGHRKMTFLSGPATRRMSTAHNCTIHIQRTLASSKLIKTIRVDRLQLARSDPIISNNQHHGH